MTTTAGVRCLLCGDSASRPVRTGVRNRPDLSVRRCPGCGLVRLDPLPTAEQAAAYYRNHYRESYDAGIDPSRAHEADGPEAARRVARLGNLLPPGGSVLEVGCGSGAFLRLAGERTARACGVEPGERWRRWAENAWGASMRSALEDWAEERFDLVCAFHVLEHVPDPVDFLRRLASRVSRGGRVAVEVPNVDDALLGLYDIPAYQDFYYQDAHLWYFSATTLSRAFRAAGLDAEVSFIQRYDLSNHMRWALTGRPGGQGHYSAVFPPSLNAAYADALIKAGRADTLWAVARTR